MVEKGRGHLAARVESRRAWSHDFGLEVDNTCYDISVIEDPFDICRDVLTRRSRKPRYCCKVLRLVEVNPVPFRLEVVAYPRVWSMRRHKTNAQADADGPQPAAEQLNQLVAAGVDDTASISCQRVGKAQISSFTIPNMNPELPKRRK